MEGRPKEDSELITRAQRGDAAAYEEIVQRYQQVAFRTAYVITGSAADAEDAAQEGFIKAYRALRAAGAPARRALPPGGCGPIPRGGSRRLGRTEALARARQRVDRRGPARHRQPLLPRAERRGDGGGAGHRGRHGQVATLEGSGQVAHARRGGLECLTSSTSYAS